MKSPRASMIDCTNRRIGAAGSILARALRSRTILRRSTGGLDRQRLAQQHGHRHLVEVGQALQAGQRQGAEAPLVGADRRCAPPALGPGLDLGERQALGLADGPEALADRPLNALVVGIVGPSSSE